MEEFPRIGVGVIIFKEGKILLGKRIGKRGAGEYAGPGGHLEYMETIEECCIRETKEECGIEIENIKFLFVGSLFRFKPRHYVHINMIADWKSGEPEVLE